MTVIAMLSSGSGIQSKRMGTATCRKEEEDMGTGGYQDQETGEEEEDSGGTEHHVLLEYLGSKKAPLPEGGSEDDWVLQLEAAKGTGTALESGT